MKEQVTQELLRLVKSAESLAIEHMPDTLQQVLVKETINCSLWSLFYIAIIFVILYVRNKLLKYDFNQNSDDIMFINIISSIAFFLTSIPLIFNLSNLLSIHLAPKAYLVEYFTN